LTQPSLFPESQEQRVQRLDAEILHLVMGGSGGPLSLTLGDAEKAVLRHIRFHRGFSNAVSIRDIAERTKLSPRSIKEAVRSLRIQFHLPVMSSKHAGQGGYFLMMTSEDLKVWVKDVTDQIRAEAEVVRAVGGNHAALEMLGQLHLEAQLVEVADHAEAD
jgi:DNA-binding IscR family transcriptional regulator